MILGIQGTKRFNSYTDFITGMGRALSNLDEGDKEFIVYSAGPHNVNAMALEFINVSERGLKARGIKTRVHKVGPKWFKENLHTLDYYLYYCTPKESYSDIYELAQAKDIPGGVVRL